MKLLTKLSTIAALIGSSALAQTTASPQPLPFPRWASEYFEVAPKDLKDGFTKICQILASPITKIGTTLTADLWGACIVLDEKLVPVNDFEPLIYDRNEIVASLIIDSTSEIALSYTPATESIIDQIAVGMGIANLPKTKSEKFVNELESLFEIPTAHAQGALGGLRKLVKILKESGRTVAELRAHLQKFKTATKMTESTQQMVVQGTVRVRGVGSMVLSTGETAARRGHKSFFVKQARTKQL